MIPVAVLLHPLLLGLGAAAAAVLYDVSRSRATVRRGRVSAASVASETTQRDSARPSRKSAATRSARMSQFSIRRRFWCFFSAARSHCIAAHACGRTRGRRCSGSSRR